MLLTNIKNYGIMYLSKVISSRPHEQTEFDIPFIKARAVELMFHRFLHIRRRVWIST